jgi:hypothetical protein
MAALACAIGRWSAEKQGHYQGRMSHREINDDLQLAAKDLHIRGKGLDLAAFELTFLDTGYTRLDDSHRLGDFNLCGVLASTHLGQPKRAGPWR